MCWCCASLVYIFAGWSTVVASREGVVFWMWWSDTKQWGQEKEEEEEA